MARFPPAQVTEEQVVSALERYNGKIVPAARLLQLSPSWLSKYLQRMGYQSIISWHKRTSA